MNIKIIWNATESHENQRNDTLPGMKTQKKKPLGQKKNRNVLLNRMQCIEL